MRRGEILLIPFPFTDLTGKKARPVVVLSTARYGRQMGSFVVAMLTSMPRSGPFDCEISRWQQAGLFLPTWARAKLATLSPRLVLRSLGFLQAEDLRRVERVVRRALGWSVP